MKKLWFVLLILAACRGENPPRDYQNAPPAMTHPPQSKQETPAAKGVETVAAEPSRGAEGKAITGQPVNPPITGTAATTTVKDQTPVTATHT
jgi:hypothetical protein